MTPRQQVYASVALACFCTSLALSYLLDATLTAQQQTTVFAVPLVVGVVCGIVAALLTPQEPPK